MLKIFHFLQRKSFRSITLNSCCNNAKQPKTRSKTKTFCQKKEEFKGVFPDCILQNRQKTPEHMYAANESIVELIDKHLDRFFKQTTCNTILEINPGNGIFTRKLLDRKEQFKKIILMETLDYFIYNLEELHVLFPDRIVIKHADFINLWKLIYLDKIAKTTKFTELLVDVPTKSYEDEPNVLVVGVVGSNEFFKRLILTMAFQTGLFTFGRPEFYLIIPPSIYTHLTCSKDIGYLTYRASTMLFQIFFEHQFIAYLPRNDFLPTQTEYRINKGDKLHKTAAANAENLYLVRIVPRRNLFELCPQEYLPFLWHFIKQNCISRGNRIIPNLEKWVPGCGLRLIIKTRSTESVKLLHDEGNPAVLPEYSTRCTTMSNGMFHPYMNIYTQFGDLNPNEILTLFNEFRKWPESMESAFVASFESSMMKADASSDDAEVCEKSDSPEKKTKLHQKLVKIC